MNALSCLLGLVVGFVLPLRTLASEGITVGVLEFTSKGGVTQDQMDALSDLLVNEIRSLGDFKVIDKGTIRSVLDLEEQRQRLSACSDQECISEIGGALGVSWVVAGNVSLFGQTYLLNLKLIDVEKIQLANGVSRSIKGGQDQLVSELPKAVKDLMLHIIDGLGNKPAQEGKAETQQQGEQPKEKTEPRQSLPAPAKTAQEEIKKTDEDGWFPRVPDRTGRWALQGSAGWVGNGSPELRGVNDEVAYLSGRRDGWIVTVAGEVSLLRWLAIVGQVSGYRSSGVASLVAENEEDNRKRSAVEIGVGLEAYWAIDAWIEPLAYLTIGPSFMGEESEDNANALPKINAVGWFLDLGVGADFFLTTDLYLGLRLGLMLHHYPTSNMTDLADPPTNTNTETYSLGESVLFSGGLFQLSAGWQF